MCKDSSSPINFHKLKQVWSKCQAAVSNTSLKYATLIENTLSKTSMNLIWLSALKHRVGGNLELLYHKVKTVKILDKNRIQIQVRSQSKARNKRLKRFAFFIRPKNMIIGLLKEIQKIFPKIFVKHLQITWQTCPINLLTNGVMR